MSFAVTGEILMSTQKLGERAVSAHRNTTPQRQGEGLVLAAAMLWGTTGTMQALAPPGASPLAIGAVRLTSGGAALLLFALGRNAFRPRQPWPFVTTVGSAASMAAYQLCFFSAVLRTGVAVGTVIAIASGPVIAGLLGMIFLHERLTRRWAMATVLAVSGGGMLLVGNGAVQVDWGGMLLALGAGASYALYTLTSKQLLQQQRAEAVAGVAFAGGALLLSPILLVTDLAWLTTARGLVVALELGLLATALPYILYVRGLLTVPVATAVTLALAEPLTATVFGVLLLDEQLTLFAVGGIVLIFTGLVLLTTGRRTATSSRPIDSADD